MTIASMGPRSDNRGYSSPVRAACGAGGALQWVRGRITAVMPPGGGLFRCGGSLQWVRGRITAVMSPACGPISRRRKASMGPRSDNRGYAGLLTSKLPRSQFAFRERIA